MRLSLLLGLLGAALVAFEAWRLSSPEVIRLRQTWTYDTRDGTRTTSEVFELRQWGAIPYLPGGTPGVPETIGGFPIPIDVSGKRYFVFADPRWLLGLKLMDSPPPPLTSDDAANTGTTSFIRKLRRVQAPIMIDFTAWSDARREFMKIGGSAGPYRQIGPPISTLPEFERQNSGFKLRSVTYQATSAELAD